VLLTLAHIRSPRSPFLDSVRLADDKATTTLAKVVSEVLHAKRTGRYNFRTNADFVRNAALNSRRNRFCATTHREGLVKMHLLETALV
jgi:hypothetical protein